AAGGRRRAYGARYRPRMDVRTPSRPRPRLADPIGRVMRCLRRLLPPSRGKRPGMPVGTNLLPPRYRGAEHIGHGGMGEIYRATDDALGRVVAVKLLAERYAEDDAIRRRFTREALAAARLSGEPNTVTIFDVGEWNERPFIVMEHLSGGTLDDRIAREGAQ